MRKPFYKIETFTGERALGYLIRRLNNLMLPRVEALFVGEDLTLSQWIVLVSLRDGFVSTCAEIARHLNHDTGATTRLVDQLERRGLVNRNRSASDRRVIHIELTPQGDAIASAFTPRIVEFWNTVLSDFAQEDAARLVDLLTHLAERVEKMPIGAADEKPEESR